MIHAYQNKYKNTFFLSNYVFSEKLFSAFHKKGLFLTKWQLHFFKKNVIVSNFQYFDLHTPTFAVMNFNTFCCLNYTIAFYESKEVLYSVTRSRIKGKYYYN